MNKVIILRGSFILASVSILVGAWFKILHYANAGILLTVGVLSIILFTVLALYEIYSSTKVNATEKIFWTIGFIFMNWIVGLVYLVAGRKRVVYLQ